MRRNRPASPRSRQPAAGATRRRATRGWSTPKVLRPPTVFRPFSPRGQREASSECPGADGPAAGCPLGQAVTLAGGGLALTGQLPPLGEVLTITRNAHVILAELGPYPALNARPDGLAAADDDGRLFADFTRWRNAEAREDFMSDASEGDRGGKASLCSLTFRDLAGQPFHRVCLLPGSDSAGFHTLVRGYARSAATAAAGPTGYPTGAGGEIVAMQRTRLPALLARAAGTGECGCGRPGCIDSVRPLKLPPAALRASLRRAGRDGMALRVTVFQQAVVHTAQFTPSPLPNDGQEEANGWLRVHDERVDLHLCLAGVSALWFTLPAPGSRAESCLEAYDARGELLAAFATANPAEDETAWRTLVWSR